MESGNQSKSGDDFQDEKESQFDMFSLTTENSSNSTITTEELMISKIYEKLGFLSVEVESVKTLFLEKNNTLGARFETMEQKLKVAELEKKLANEQMAKVFEEKMNKMNDQLEEKQRKFMEEMEQKFEEQTRLVKSEMTEKNAKSKEEPQQDVQQELNGQGMKMTEKDKKLKFVWSINRWDISDHFQMNEDGLMAATEKSARTNLFAQLPISREILASMSTGSKLVYYEVLLKNSRDFYVGWVGQEMPIRLNSNEFWVGNRSDSYAISSSGACWRSYQQIVGYANGFQSDDLVGSGVLLTRDGRLKLFFTKNGQMNGKPMHLVKLDLLYPAVIFPQKNASLEANFGADPRKKPFKFDINAHEAQLFV